MLDADGAELLAASLIVALRRQKHREKAPRLVNTSDIPIDTQIPSKRR